MGVNWRYWCSSCQEGVVSPCLLHVLVLTCIPLSSKVTNGTVQVELRVTNREFTEDLCDSSSPTYVEFVANFTKQVKGRREGADPTWGGRSWGPHPPHGCSKRWGGFLLVIFSGCTGVCLEGGHPKMREIQEEGRSPDPEDLFSSR